MMKYFFTLIFLFPSFAFAKISGLGFFGGSYGRASMGNGAASAVDRSLHAYSPDLFLGIGPASGRLYFGLLTSQEAKVQIQNISETGSTDLSGQGLVLSPSLYFRMGAKAHAMLGYRILSHTLDRTDIFGVHSAYKGSGAYLRLGIQPFKSPRWMVGLAYTSDTYTESLNPNIKSSAFHMTLSWRIFGGGGK